MVSIEHFGMAHSGAYLTEEARLLLLNKRDHELRRVLLHNTLLLCLKPLHKGLELLFGVSSDLQRDLGRNHGRLKLSRRSVVIESIYLVHG